MLVAAACGGPLIQLPSHGGPAWLEVRSEHFTLWTDGSAERGRELVREMERRREVILTAMNNLGSRTRTFVIAVRDRIELGGYRSSCVGTCDWDAHNPTGQPGLGLEINVADRKVINRAMAHVLSVEVIAHPPEWLSQGIVEYFSTFDVVPGRAYAEIGAPDSWLQVSRSTLPTARVFACTDGYKSREFDATSWAMFSMLINDHYDRFNEFLHRLDDLHDPSDEGSRGPPIATSPRDTPTRDELVRKREQLDQRRCEREAQAWRDSFPDLPPDKLDDALQAWLSIGKARLPRIPVTARGVAVTERALSDADVLAVRGWLGFLYSEDNEVPRHDAEAALALDRTNVLARLTEAAVTHSITPADARATVSAHPEDWRALRLVESALYGTPEGDEARRRACAMSGNSAPECPRAARAPTLP
jgi:hypothetical protein